MNISFYFAIIIIIFFFHKIYKENINIPFCKWKVLENNTFDKSKSKIVRSYFNMLKKLNVVYFLGFGSELGALRNGGVIKNDHDVDVIIPIWLNYNIFKCNEYISYYPTKCKIYSSIGTKVCNSTKHKYMIMFREYIHKKVKRNIYYNCRIWGKYGYTSCWMMLEKGFFLDIWIMIGNEYFYQQIDICKCNFSLSSSFCTENAIENSIKLYGDKWNIPVKKGSGEINCNVVLSPNNSNSKIKYIHQFNKT